MAKPAPLDNQRLVLPVEHVLVHKEYKKLYLFCQAGSISTLRELFAMLKQIDGMRGPSKQAVEQEES